MPTSNLSNQFEMSPFEWTMTNRAAASPMEFVLQLNGNGKVDTQLFNDAIVAELKQQPLLQSNASVGPTHRLSHWCLAKSVAPQICWSTEKYSDGDGLPVDFAPIDLENEIGFRFYGWRFQNDNAPCVVMKFMFHHACCDGKGGLEFIEQVLLNYQSRLESGGGIERLTSKQNRSLERDLPPIKKLSMLERCWRSVVVRPRRVAKVLLSKPVQIVNRKFDDQELAVGPPRHCSVTLDQATTAALGRFANSLGTTTNLVVARELFLALKAHGQTTADGKKASRRNQRLRILIPFSLRDERHQTMAVANCVSMAFLEASEHALGNGDASGEAGSALLNELTEQFKFIRRWQLEYSWIESIESFAKLWPVLKHFAKRNVDEDGRKSAKSIATCVMSNLGRVFRERLPITSEGYARFGELEIETVHLVLPCNTALCVNFSLNFYSDRLTLDVSFLPTLISAETAQSMLDLWAKKIVDSAGSVSETSAQGSSKAIL